MKLAVRAVIAIAASAVSLSCLAQQVVGTSPSSRKQLDVFDSPASATPARQVASDDAGLPLDIRSSKSGFHEVVIQGQPGWLRNAQVRVSKNNSGACPKASAKLPSVISTPGAGNNGCQ